MSKAELTRAIEVSGRYIKVRIGADGQVTGMLAAEDYRYHKPSNTGGRRYIGQFSDPDLMRDYE